MQDQHKQLEKSERIVKTKQGVGKCRKNGGKVSTLRKIQHARKKAHSIISKNVLCL
jgi:hypothetical protein